jgi:hypothetical protein
MCLQTKLDRLLVATDGTDYGEGKVREALHPVVQGLQALPYIFAAVHSSSCLPGPQTHAGTTMLLLFFNSQACKRF